MANVFDWETMHRVEDYEEIIRAYARKRANAATSAGSILLDADNAIETILPNDSSVSLNGDDLVI